MAPAKPSALSRTVEVALRSKVLAQIVLRSVAANSTAETPMLGSDALNFSATRAMPFVGGCQKKKSPTLEKYGRAFFLKVTSVSFDT